MTYATPTPTGAATLADDAYIAPRGIWAATTRFLRRQPVGSIGIVIVTIFGLCGLFADWIAPYNPTANDFAAMTQAPGWVVLFGGHFGHDLIRPWLWWHIIPVFFSGEFWRTVVDPATWQHALGTDQLGRDILSRILFGARTAFVVGITSAAVGGFSGLILGVGSAYFGGRTDLILQRINDIIMSFPLIIMALAVVSIFGTGVQNVIIAITIPLIPRCQRVVRSSALAIRSVPYIDAARALGYSHSRIILAHMAPNVVAPFLIMLTSFVGQAILAEASLSYLGLGVQEPVAAWGLMLQGGAEEYASTAPWIAVFPGLAIMLTVFGINLFGDALRDVLDPKLRDR